MNKSEANLIIKKALITTAQKYGYDSEQIKNIFYDLIKGNYNCITRSDNCRNEVSTLENIDFNKELIDFIILNEVYMNENQKTRDLMNQITYFGNKISTAIHPDLAIKSSYELLEAMDEEFKKAIDLYVFVNLYNSFLEEKIYSKENTIAANDLLERSNYYYNYYNDLNKKTR